MAVTKTSRYLPPHNTNDGLTDDANGSDNSIDAFATPFDSDLFVGGIGIRGTDPVHDMDNGLREIMSHLADLNAGEAPISDGFSIGTPSDESTELDKQARFDVSDVTKGQRRILKVPDTNGTVVLSDDAGKILDNRASNFILPIGAVIFSPTGMVFPGFLACDGTTFIQADYQELYAVLGSNELPDMQDRVARGAGPLAGAAGTKQEDEFASHQHLETIAKNPLAINAGVFGTGMSASESGASFEGADVTDAAEGDELHNLTISEAPSAAAKHV